MGRLWAVGCGLWVGEKAVDCRLWAMRRGLRRKPRLLPTAHSPQPTAFIQPLAYVLQPLWPIAWIKAFSDLAVSVH